MNKGKLYFTIGLPRSGKSTFCNKWAHILDDTIQSPTSAMTQARSNPRAIVSGDDIRLVVTGERYNSHIEELVFPMEHIFIKCLLSRGFDVIADDTHTSWKSIHPLLQIDPDATPLWIANMMNGGQFFELGRPQSYFDEHVQTCKDRASLTNQSDLIPVIERMSRQMIDLYQDFKDGKLEEARRKARLFKHRIATT